MNPESTEVTSSQLFEEKLSPNAHPLVKMAWEEVMKDYFIKKNPGGKQEYRELWLIMVKDAFSRQFIEFSSDPDVTIITKGPVKKDKFLCEKYVNASGKLCLVVGYDVKPPDTYHLMIKLL